MRPPSSLEPILENAARALAKMINDGSRGYRGWPENGLHRRGQRSTGNSLWTVVRSTNGWVATSGRRYGQWVQPRGVAGKARGRASHGYEVARDIIPRFVSDLMISLNSVTGRQISITRYHALGRRVEFRMNPAAPDDILVEMYKNGVDR